eukprot:1159429-Pelagomonas_calceolata.AAC.1
MGHAVFSGVGWRLSDKLASFCALSAYKTARNSFQGAHQASQLPDHLSCQPFMHDTTNLAMSSRLRTWTSHDFISRSAMEHKSAHSKGS